MRHQALALAAALLAGAAAHADVVLFDSLGFESPHYAVGPLLGQNGWVNSFGGPLSADVQTGVVFSGQQAVSIAASATGWLWPTINYAPASGEIIEIAFDLRRDAPESLASFGYLIDVYNSGGARIARAGLGNAATPGLFQPILTGRIDGASPSGTFRFGDEVAPGAWVSFRMLLDFDANAFKVIAGGASAELLLAIHAAGDLGDADIMLSVPGDDVGYLDNYRIAVIPEPASLAAIAGGALLSRRRRA